MGVIEVESYKVGHAARFIGVEAEVVLISRLVKSQVNKGPLWVAGAKVGAVGGSGRYVSDIVQVAIRLIGVRVDVRWVSNRYPDPGDVVVFVRLQHVIIRIYFRFEPVMSIGDIRDVDVLPGKTF